MRSEEFLRSFEECVRLLCSVALRDLKEHGFSGQHPSNSLPLASLLPKIKACTERLLPSNLDRNPTALDMIRSQCCGPHCESMCMSIFDNMGFVAAEQERKDAGNGHRHMSSSVSTSAPSNWAGLPNGHS